MANLNTPQADFHSQSLRIGFLGSEGSGKTCFLAALNWLANDQENAPFSIAAVNSPTQVIFNELNKAFREHRLPAPTHRTDDLVFDVRYGKRQYRITTHDIEGEAFKRVGNEMQTDDPIFADLEVSDVLFVFLDAERDVKNADSESARIDAIGNLLKRFDMAGKHKRVAVLLTKADVIGIDSPSPAEAARFLKEHLPALYKQLDSEIHESAVFFLAAIGHGELADGRDPQPMGFPELLDWIQAGFDALEARQRRRRCLRITAGCLVALVCAAGLYATHSRKQKAADEIVANPDASVAELRENLKQASQDAQQQVSEELGRKARQLIENAKSWEDVATFYKEQFSPTYKNLSDSLREPLRAEQVQLRDRAESLFADDIRKRAETGDDVGVDKMADQYGKLVEEGAFPGKRGSEIAKAKEESLNHRKRAAKRIINNIVIGSGDRQLLQKKTTLVDDFQFYSESEREEAKRATELSRRFQSNAKYSLSKISIGTLEKRKSYDLLLSNRTFVRISVGNEDRETAIKTAEHPEWSKSELSQCSEVTWETGQPILVEWFWKEKVGYSVPIATKRFEGSSLSMLEMLTTESLDLSDHKQRPKMNGSSADFKVKCDGFDDPSQDLYIFKKYIDPGTYWEDL